MFKRIVSGVIGAAFALAVIIFNKNLPMAINIVVALICMLSMNEIFTAMGISKYFIITIPSLIFVAIMPILGIGLIWEVSWYLYTLLIFGFMVVNYKSSIHFRDIAVCYSMALLITFSLSSITALKDFGGEYASFLIMVSLGIAWTSDTGAYFCGKAFGKTKLCQSISPKKTIEGAIGGLIICIISIMLIGVVFNTFIFPEKIKINYVMLALMGLIGSPISVMGDLCFSMVKRGCHVKDFGNVIPGHGGILDRFDSVIFVAPYAYIFMQFLPIINI